jgi:hypothetical protein
VRLANFKREYIERAILLQDVLDSSLRGDRHIRSVMLKDRDPASRTQRVAIFLSKLIVYLTISSIVYVWYMWLRPFASLVTALGCFGLSGLILYAEIANFFGLRDNAIYNLVTAPQFDDASGYFLAHVSCFSCC